MKISERMNKNRRRANQGQRVERGYALVALMAVMMFSLILMTAAAPTLQKEMQREKEEEMLWRGQQVARAIRDYPTNTGRVGAYPTSLKELVDGFTRPDGKKVHLLRPSALCDPMTPCGEGETNWRLVNPGDPLPRELLEAIITSQQKNQAIVNLPALQRGVQELAKLAQMGTVDLPGQPSDTKLDGVIGQPENKDGGSTSDGGSASDDSTQGDLIIGVVSKKTGKMFRSYYGIEEYDHALFFPYVPVMAGGFINPLSFDGMGGAGGVGAGGQAVNDPRCPAGGVFANGRCVGAPGSSTNNLNK
jgi:type II secretory pathway pseudopilin PulG